jgi:RES domain-containing protein
LTTESRGGATRAPKILEFAGGTQLWRVSKDAAGTAFSTFAGHRARFSPILAADGSVVPAWYGATSEAGAIFESVFHDIRPSHRSRRVLPNQYIDRILAQVVTVRPLRLVDLTTDGLHVIGRSRARLIESTSRRYAWTIEQAEQLLSAAPEADGFLWVSRARDTSMSLVLYEKTGRSPMIAPGSGASAPLGVGAGLVLLRRLATAANITVVIGET